MLIIGVGNRMRRDDGVGPMVADRFREGVSAGWCVVEHSGEGASLMELWQGCAAAVIIDATRSGRPAGTITRIAAERESVPASFFHYSTHAFGVAEAIETARALERLPERIVLFGVEGADFDMGEGLSPAVNAAIAPAVALVRREIQAVEEEIAPCTNSPL
jgi:hydrogenase maturation protease